MVISQRPQMIQWADPLTDSCGLTPSLIDCYFKQVRRLRFFRLLLQHNLLFPGLYHYHLLALICKTPWHVTCRKFKDKNRPRYCPQEIYILGLEGQNPTMHNNEMRNNISVSIYWKSSNALCGNISFLRREGLKTTFYWEATALVKVVTKTCRQYRR